MCQYVCLSVCLSVWLSVSRPSVHPSIRPSGRPSDVVKCPSKNVLQTLKTLMLPTLLNYPGIRKHFYSPLHFKPSKATYRISKCPSRTPSRPPARSPALPSIRSALAHRIATRPLARPSARPTVNQTKQYLLDWPPALRLHTSTIHNLLYSFHYVVYTTIYRSVYYERLINTTIYIVVHTTICNILTASSSVHYVLRSVHYSYKCDVSSYIS